MKIGTKTLLFGCHQFLIHPWYVYRAWKKIYGTRPNFWETVCIVIHDWGYWGCGDIDGEEGDRHPEWAANILFSMGLYGAYDLCLYHSASQCAYEHEVYTVKAKPSKLYWADKLGTVSMPPGLWVTLGKLTGEMEEYVTNPKYQREGCGIDPYKHFEYFREIVEFNLMVEFEDYGQKIE